MHRPFRSYRSYMQGISRICARSSHTRRKAHQVLANKLLTDKEVTQSTRKLIRSVLDGRTPMLAADDPFNFKCTACGECCRNFGSSLYLGSDDLFRLTRSEIGRRSGIDTSTSLLCNVSEGVRVEAQVVGRGFIAPVCRLQTVSRDTETGQHAHRHSGTPTPSHTDTDKTEHAPRRVRSRDDRCVFAVPLRPKSSTSTTTPSDTQKNTTTDGRREQTRIQSATPLDSDQSHMQPSPSEKGTGRVKLTCGLGPDVMPTKCSSFPIARGLEEIQGFYFGIDGCEGLVPEATDISGDRTSHINGKVIVKPPMGHAHEQQRADVRQSEATSTSHNERDTLRNAQQAQALGTHTDEGTPNQTTTSKESVRKTLGQGTMLNRPKKKTQTVQDYVQRNALADRWKRADWFRKCREKAIDAIVQSPIESSPKVNARLVALLGHIWYDFDSLTPRGRISGGWEELITAIDTHTDEFVQCLVKAAEIVSASEANGQENIEHSAGTQWERAVDEATASMYARINQRTM